MSAQSWHACSKHAQPRPSSFKNSSIRWEKGEEAGKALESRARRAGGQVPEPSLGCAGLGGNKVDMGPRKQREERGWRGLWAGLDSRARHRHAAAGQPRAAAARPGAATAACASGHRGRAATPAARYMPHPSRLALSQQVAAQSGEQRCVVRVGGEYRKQSKRPHSEWQQGGEKGARSFGYRSCGGGAASSSAQA